MRILVITVFMLIWSQARIVYSQVYDVETSGEYVMGDSDTKLEARRIALEHAKRLAAEQIGTYLESETIVRNSRLEKDEIRSYTSAILKTTVLSEGINLLSDKTTVFSIKIKANVDTKVLEQKIKAIKSDSKRLAQLENLQIENIKLLKDLETISAQLRTGKTEEYKKLREKRETLFERLDKNQNSISLTFDKGTLLNLALKNKNEFDDLKSKVDDALKFYIKHVKYKIGEAQVINRKNTSDILVNVDMWLENGVEYIDLLKNFSGNMNFGEKDIDMDFFEKDMSNNDIDKIEDEYIDLLKNFSEDIKNKNGIILSISNYKGEVKQDELKNYIDNNCSPRLKIKAGKYHTFESLYSYGAITLKHSWQVTIPRIPTVELSSIGSIDAEVVCQYGVNKKTKEKTRKRSK